MTVGAFAQGGAGAGPGLAGRRGFDFGSRGNDGDRRAG